MSQRKRATALGTYDQNRTSNGAADVLYVLLKSLTALGLQALFFERDKMRRVTKIARASRLINGRKKNSISKSLKPPQTYDTRFPAHYVYSLKIHDVPEVNFFDKKKSSDYITFTDVFEFSSDSKKTIDFKITLVLLMFLSFFSSQVRSEDFM